MSCYSNTTYLSRPTKIGQQVCCSSGGFNPTGRPRAGLGPRKKRERVREDIKDFVLAMLGAPNVTIELNEQNLDLAVDQALKVYEEYAPREYFEYYVFDTVPGKSVYEMPPEVGIIRSVHYEEQGNLAFSASDLGGALPLEYFSPGGSYAGQSGMLNPVQPVWGQMGEWVLYKSYEQLYNNVSSNTGSWEFIGSYRHVKIHPVPCGGRCGKVIVRYVQERKDWDNVTEAMQMGALAYAKIQLGRVRSKIANPPGPGGGIQLDGQQLLQEGSEDLKQWREDLISRYGDLLGPMWG